MNIKKQCNHDLNDKHNTLLVGKKHTMVYPPTIDCYCFVCHKVLNFIKDSEGYTLSIKVND